MNKKRLLALLLTLAMAFSLAACGGGGQGSATPTPAPQTQAPQGGGEATPAPSNDKADEITLWTYPIGNWGNEAAVKTLTDAFTAETGISVTVEYLAYADGDDKVNSALTANSAPDLIMEGPERLVANWGVGGHMVDLSDMLDDTDRSEINSAVMSACTAPDGSVYEYPLVMTAHCMAVNLEAFKEAGASKFLDLENHTWTTEDFLSAVEALYNHYGETVGAVYCVGQGGDQGTRALVNNLYGGTFTNAEHTEYTWDDPKNIQALEKLYEIEGITFDASIAGGDEIALFYQGVLKMAFCWNIAQQLNPNSGNTGAGKTVTGDEIVFMGFPSESGEPQLQGGIWGFGIFDNGDAGRIAAAKEFIKYMADSEHTVEAVKTANYFSVRSAAEGTDLSSIWVYDENDPALAGMSDEERLAEQEKCQIMDEYTKLMPYLGDYYQVTSGWAQARTSWWNMLQRVGAGDSITDSVATFAAEANAAAAG